MRCVQPGAACKITELRWRFRELGCTDFAVFDMLQRQLGSHCGVQVASYYIISMATRDVLQVGVDSVGRSHLFVVGTVHRRWSYPGRSSAWGVPKLTFNHFDECSSRLLADHRSRLLRVPLLPDGCQAERCHVALFARRRFQGES